MSKQLNRKTLKINNRSNVKSEFLFNSKFKTYLLNLTTKYTFENHTIRLNNF